MHPVTPVKKKPVRMLSLMLVMAAQAGSLLAQNIVSSIPESSATAAMLRNAAEPPPPSQPPAPPQTPYKLGPVLLHPRLTYRYMNAEGLPVSGGRKVASEIFTFAPGLALDFGEHWSLDYSPTWVSYTARAMSDTFDQSVSLNGAATFQNLSLEFTQNYAFSSPFLVETGTQTEQKTWKALLVGNYDFSPQVRVQATGGLDERYTDMSPDTRAWSNKTMLILNFTERLTLLLGPGFDYTEIAAAPDTYSESYTAQINWRMTDKLMLNLNGGRQYTHSNSSAGVDLSNPLLDLSLDYRPFASTTLTLAASRSVAPSYFLNLRTESSQWSATLDQRLLGRCYFNATYRRSRTDYVATTTFANSSRSDKIDSFSARLSTKILGRLTVSGIFELNENSSTSAAFSFSTKQYGVALNYGY